MAAWMDDDRAERKRRGLHRIRRRIESSAGSRVCYRGREFLNFGSNDYLNYAADRRLASAAVRAARRFGTGAGASPLVCGHLPPHRALERALARWQGTESALVFASGFAANLAVVSSLAGPEDAIFSDELNHASLIDGCRLSCARIHIYRHADADHLEELLRQGPPARRRLIVTETIFSMDGDFAPVPALFDLACQHDCLLVCDEAHAGGVLGENGRGLAPRHDRVVKVGTQSKALGAQGGFICGSRQLTDWLVNHARPYIFSTAPGSSQRRRCSLCREAGPGRTRTSPASFATCRFLARRIALGRFSRKPILLPDRANYRGRIARRRGVVRPAGGIRAAGAGDPPALGS